MGKRFSLCKTNWRWSWPITETTQIETEVLRYSTRSSHLSTGSYYSRLAPNTSCGGMDKLIYVGRLAILSLQGEYVTPMWSMILCTLDLRDRNCESVFRKNLQASLAFVQVRRFPLGLPFR